MSLKMMFLRNYFLIDKNSFFPHLDLHFWFLDTRIDNERPWILEKDRGRYLQLRMDQEVDAQSSRVIYALWFKNASNSKVVNRQKVWFDSPYGQCRSFTTPLCFNEV